MECGKAIKEYFHVNAIKMNLELKVDYYGKSSERTRIESQIQH